MKDGRLTAMAPPADCRVRLLGDVDDDPATYPCTAPFRPPRGHYVAWIETRDSISRNVVRLDHHETSGQQQILSPLVPAATLEIPVQRLDPALRVVVLQLGGPGPFRRELSVHAALREPVLMPSGRLLVVVFNQRREVVEISRPVHALPGVTNAVGFSHPSDKADLVALVDASASSPEAPVDLAVDNEGRDRLADLYVPDGERSLAVWYGLEPGRARVTVKSERLYLESRETQLRAGSTSTVQAVLRNRPALTVRIQASEKDADSLVKAKALLRVSAEGDGRVLGETSLGKSLTHRFELMPPEILDVALEIRSWKIRQRVDLSSGIDTDATVEVESLDVSGVVTYGGERVPARIQFRRDDEVSDVVTDDAGHYEVVLWQPGRFVAEIWLRDRPDAPSHQDFVRIDATTNTLDFRIPRTSYPVHVVDDDTGKPIGRALVMSFNTWIDAKEGERRIGRPVFTDASGHAELPPLRPGEIEVRVSADGYMESQPIRFVVPESDITEKRAALELRLEPLGRRERVRIILPNGSAATGARLLSVTDSVPPRGLWQGVADADGVVEIPEAVEGSVLLVRHPGAGSLVQRWTRSQTERLTLPPAAAPLVVKVVRSGDQPARFAQITAWIGSLPVSSAGLMFLTDQPASTDGDGIWTGRNLPAASIRLAATTARSALGREARALESLATLISHPWPSTVVLQAIE